MLPHLPWSFSPPSWKNQFFQSLPVSQVFQATTMPLSVPCSPASSLDQQDAVLCLAQSWQGRNGDFPKPTSGMTSGTTCLALSPFQTSVLCIATRPDPPCSAAASLALPHSIILCLSPPSKRVLSTPLYWISLHWSQTVSPICQDHFDFQPYKVLANCASPPRRNSQILKCTFYSIKLLLNNINNSSTIQHCLFACCSPFPSTSQGTRAVSTLARETEKTWACPLGGTWVTAVPWKQWVMHVVPCSASCCCQHQALGPHVWLKPASIHSQKAAPMCSVHAWGCWSTSL